MYLVSVPLGVLINWIIHAHWRPDCIVPIRSAEKAKPNARSQKASCLRRLTGDLSYLGRSMYGWIQLVPVPLATVQACVDAFETLYSATQSLAHSPHLSPSTLSLPPLTIHLNSNVNVNVNDHLGPASTPVFFFPLFWGGVF